MLQTVGPPDYMTYPMGPSNYVTHPARLPDRASNGDDRQQSNAGSKDVVGLHTPEDNSVDLEDVERITELW